MERTHETLVTDQFGPRAQDYVTSAVHAQGADLDDVTHFVHGKSDARVLDLGCGGGHVTYRAAPHVRAIVAYDLSADMLAAVTATAQTRGLINVTTEQGAAERLPFADASFDAVVSRYSAHHWRDLDAALREARRVLKPGGAALFLDAISSGQPMLDTHLQAIEVLRDPSHARDYSAGEWLAALARAGFATTAVTYRRQPLDFASWVQRMRTPDAHIAAIRSLQTDAAADIRRHFAIASDGSFTLDIATFCVRAF